MSDPNVERPRFWLSAALSLLTLGATCLAAATMPETAGRNGTLWDRVVAKFNVTRFVTMTRDQAEQQMEGYYEGLFQSSARAVSVNTLISGRWAADWATFRSINLREDTTRRRGDFLYYDLRPNLDVEERPGRLVTNSFGMADREYTTERRPGTRRGAYIGDSLARGLGSNPGANYESRLEDHLNEMRPAGTSLEYELLNFGVEGYRITQMVEVARTKASDFSPDYYAIVLSDLSVSRKWSDHIAQLVADGIDLQYDYLRNLVRRADLRVDDDAVLMQAKLEPYRMETLRWALETIQSIAAERGAETLVILVPTVGGVEQVEAWFEGVRDLVAESGIPMLDLLGSFSGISDLARYRIADYDAHPTDLGHAIIFNEILEQLQINPAAQRLITG